MVLFNSERQTVRTLIHSRTSFVGAYSDTIQGTEILRPCMMLALLNSTFDTLVNLTHFQYLLFRPQSYYDRNRKKYRWKILAFQK